MKHPNIIGPRFTLQIRPDIAEQVVDVQTSTTTGDLTEDDLSALYATPVSHVVEKPASDHVAIEQIVTLEVPATPRPPAGDRLIPPPGSLSRHRPDFSQPPALSQILEIEDDDALVLQTVSIRAVKQRRAQKRTRTFLISIAILIASLLFLCLLALVIFVLPNLLYKIAILIVFLIACSYVISVQVKRIDRARQQAFLTVTQLVRVVKKDPASSKDEDMKHLKLIKQDTAVYLRALTTRNLKKGSH